MQKESQKPRFGCYCSRMQKFEAINVGEVRALNRPEETKEYTPIDEEENCVRNDNFRHKQSENDAENPEN